MHENTPHDAHTEATETEVVPRPTVRVLLLDEADRLLLFSSQDDSDGHTFWYPAGGGREEGETFEQAAAREVAEETGLTGLVLGADVWRRRKIAPVDGVTYDFQEHYYLARVQSFDIDTDGFTESECVSILGHHWWTLDELATTTDRLVPDDLHPRLVELLTVGVPREPINLTP